jgi:hypothetical protein
MSIALLTRRSLIKAGLMMGAVAFCGLRFSSEAYAKVQNLVKTYMQDRLTEVYYADAAMPVRASQDNEQIKATYANFIGKTGGEQAHHYLHMHFRDRSAALKALEAAGELKNPGAERFKDAKYPFEWISEWFKQPKS